VSADTFGLEAELARARDELAFLETWCAPGHPWRLTCGTARGDHTWCAQRVEQARERVAELVERRDA
jgi:hypothetical protein